MPPVLSVLSIVIIGKVIISIVVVSDFVSKHCPGPGIGLHQPLDGVTNPKYKFYVS